jgi:alcohol dehydrogenase
MMKAAIYESFGGEIRVVQNVPIPQVPEDGVLIQVMATGVCRSDWHGWKGHDGDIHQHGLPFCPGHEFSGIVVKAGSQVGKIQVGDRVAVPFILSCGSCRYCRPPQNQPTICADQKQPGFTQWGSFAEYVAIPRADRNLRKLPERVSFVQAAALGCRFTTAYRAVYQQGQLQAGQSVAVFGCGGLGLSCIMLAVARRAKTIVAVDVSVKALEKAKSLGATHAVQVQPKQSSEAIAQAVNQILLQTEDEDGIDLTLDAAGFAATSEAAVYATRPGGRMVQVGLHHTPPSIPMSRVAGKEITIVGSHGFDANVLPDLLDLVASNPALDPCQLVHAEVSLEEGCRALEAMDRESPLGIVMITDFDDASPKNSASRL